MKLDQHISKFPPQEIPLLFGAEKEIPAAKKTPKQSQSTQQTYRARWWSSQFEESEWSPPFMRKPR